MKINDFKQFNESAMTCSECGGPAFSDLILAEKQDACYNKVKSRYKVWPSAYASGALVQCRKKGAANWGNKSEGVEEGVLDWAKEKYHDYQTGRQWNKFGKAQRKGDADGMQAAQDAAAAHRDKLQVARQNRTGSTLSKDSSMGVGQDVANLKALKAKGVAEAEKNPHTSALGKALYRDLSKEKKASPAQVEKNKARWAQRQADKEQGVMEQSQEDSPVARATLHRIMMRHPGMLAQHGPERVMQAVNDVADLVGDMDDIGSSDISGWVNMVQEILDSLDQDVAEGSEQIDELSPGTLNSYVNKARAQVRASPGANPNNSHLPTDPKIANRARGAVKADNRLHGFGPAKKSTQGVSEGYRDRRDAYQRDQYNAEYGMNKYQSRAYSADGGANDERHDLDPTDWYVVKDGKMFAISVYPRQEQEAISLGYSRTKQEARAKANSQGVAEDYNPEYDDEAGMADNNLETLARAVEGIDDLIQSGDNLPEWCQEKIAVAKSMLVAVWDYMYSEEASDEVDPEVDEMFEAMDQLAEEIAARDNIDVDLVWESFESLDDHMLYETAAWRRKEGKSKKGGLNAKGVASYRRENPGSKLQMAVTTKPSKLKPGSKAAKRRKSFCARMSGVKGPMKKPNGKPTRKALALRKWNC